jgi:hypothetical protein
MGSTLFEHALRGLVLRWRRECDEARAEGERLNARLLAGEVITCTATTGPQPMGKEEAARELEELLDEEGRLDRSIGGPRE